jgi:tetratricopeptide (TPR) repeat protein
VSLVEGPSSRSWLKYEIDRRKGDWKLAALDLEECLSQTSDPESSLRVKYTLAAIYRDNTKEYDKAIKLYTDISNPPRSLWELQIAYRAAGKKKECYRVLTELMSIFPDYGARSAYQMALYREADGEKEAAINLYKRLLRQKEWKKSPESSQAHQKLERYGIATGGAVINEVH